MTTEKKKWAPPEAWEPGAFPAHCPLCGELFWHRPCEGDAHSCPALRLACGPYPAPRYTADAWWKALIEEQTHAREVGSPVDVFTISLMQQVGFLRMQLQKARAAIETPPTPMEGLVADLKATIAARRREIDEVRERNARLEREVQVERLRRVGTPPAEGHAEGVIADLTRKLDSARDRGANLASELQHARDQLAFSGKCAIAREAAMDDIREALEKCRREINGLFNPKGQGAP